MIQAFSISLSGLQAQEKRLAVSADNVANQRSRRVDPEGPAEQPGAFQPKRVQDVTLGGGGVRGELRPVTPASVRSYEPSSPDADAEGLVNRPNVNLAEELVTQMQAQRAYEANAAAIRTQDEMTDALLDIKS